MYKRFVFFLYYAVECFICISHVLADEADMTVILNITPTLDFFFYLKLHKTGGFKAQFTLSDFSLILTQSA